MHYSVNAALATTTSFLPPIAINSSLPFGSCAALSRALRPPILSAPGIFCPAPASPGGHRRPSQRRQWPKLFCCCCPSDILQTITKATSLEGRKGDHEYAVRGGQCRSPDWERGLWRGTGDGSVARKVTTKVQDDYDGLARAPMHGWCWA